MKRLRSHDAGRARELKQGGFRLRSTVSRASALEDRGTSTLRCRNDRRCLSHITPGRCASSSVEVRRQEAFWGNAVPELLILARGLKTNAEVERGQDT
jgi:hypothetical protein